MSNAAEPPNFHPNPRPGVLKTLGICNIVFAILGMLCIGYSMMITFVAASMSPAKAEVRVEVKGRANPAPSPGVPVVVKVQANAAPGPGTPMAAGFNPFMGFEDKNFQRFSYVENGVGFLINGLMFATGIGLINLRRWGVRGWGYLAWIRIVSVFFLWGYFIVAVAPGFSEAMARNVAAQFSGQGIPQGRGPSVADLTRIYSIMFLIIAVGAMLVTSIYPAISLWLLSRPGVKAAIVDKPALEHELP